MAVTTWKDVISLANQGDRLTNKMRPTDWPTELNQLTNQFHGAESFLKKLTVTQLVKKFPTFYGTWGIITTFTKASHMSLSWARCVQSTPSHPISQRSILILSSHLFLGLLSGLFLQVFWPKFCTHFSFLPCMLHALHISSSLISTPQYVISLIFNKPLLNAQTLKYFHLPSNSGSKNVRPWYQTTFLLFLTMVPCGTCFMH